MREQSMPAVASTGIAGLLDGPVVQGEVVGTTASAAYVRVPPVTCMALEAAGAVGLPCGLTVADPAALDHVARGMPVAVGDGRVEVGVVVLHVARWRNPCPRLAPTTAAALAQQAAVARNHLPGPVSTVDRRVADGLAEVVAALARSDRGAAVAASEGLIGLGAGSTPSGDDVLAGLVAGGQLLARAVGTDPEPFARFGAAVAVRAVNRTPLLSAALLWYASRAAVADPAAGVLQALCGTGDLDRAVAALLAVGHTSGADLLAGIVAAAEFVTASAPSGADREVAHG